VAPPAPSAGRELMMKARQPSSRKEPALSHVLRRVRSIWQSRHRDERATVTWRTLADRVERIFEHDERLSLFSPRYRRRTRRGENAANARRGEEGRST